MASSQSIIGRVVDRIAASPGRIVGAVGALAGAGHFAGWTHSTGSGWPDALSASEVSLVVGEIGAYVAAHPAYVALFFAGVAVAVFAE